VFVYDDPDAVNCKAVAMASGEVVARLVPSQYLPGFYWAHIFRKGLPEDFIGTPQPCRTEREMVDLLQAALGC
jgi:hypothetical protein